MKNPYYFNFLWLGGIVVALSCFMFGPCLSSTLCVSLTSSAENILLGILSSAILLLLTEFIYFLVDRNKYGFLKTRFCKQVITQVNEGRARSNNIADRDNQEIQNGIKFINDSIYHELRYYSCDSIQYFTELKYHYHGIYTGTVEYLDHEKSDWRNGKIIKIKALITLNLNLANKMTGSGSYKYFNRNDFGKFEFQVDEQNFDRILVSYANTIPSGLAEGYEVWTKC